jgi:hypothetical protein
MAELGDVLRILSRGDFLCLACLANALAVTPTEAEGLIQRVVAQVQLSERGGDCPRCRVFRRLFALG